MYSTDTFIAGFQYPAHDVAIWNIGENSYTGSHRWLLLLLNTVRDNASVLRYFDHPVYTAVIFTVRCIRAHIIIFCNLYAHMCTRYIIIIICTFIIVRPE